MVFAGGELSAETGGGQLPQEVDLNGVRQVGTEFTEPGRVTRFAGADHIIHHALLGVPCGERAESFKGEGKILFR